MLPDIIHPFPDIRTCKTYPDVLYPFMFVQIILGPCALITHFSLQSRVFMIIIIISLVPGPHPRPDISHLTPIAIIPPPDLWNPSSNVYSYFILSLLRFSALFPFVILDWIHLG